jgi:hypothetical protein
MVLHTLMCTQLHTETIPQKCDVIDNPQLQSEDERSGLIEGRVGGAGRSETGGGVTRGIYVYILFLYNIHVYNSSSLAFYWHSKKISDPPLCPNRLTKRRTYRPRSVIYRYVSRQSSEK